MIYRMNAAKAGASACNTSQVVELKSFHCSIYLFSFHIKTYPPLRHDSYIVRKDKFVAQEKFLPKVVQH